MQAKLGGDVSLVSIQETIAAQYSGLSAKLKDAADYVAENPVDIATRSLRAVSSSAGLAPATFSRLARALGFETYEEMRELSRDAVGRQVVSFSEKAQRLQLENQDGSSAPFMSRQAAACVANIEASANGIDHVRLNAAVENLHAARQVVLFGALGSTGLAEYMAYMGNYFASNWTLAGRMGASLASAMAEVGPSDAVVVITKPPFARRSILAAKMAERQGAYLVVITDTHTCPALKYASAGFILPSESPQFFSSYAATLVFLETIVGMLVARSGPEAMARIEDVVARSNDLEEFWAPHN